MKRKLFITVLAGIIAFTGFAQDAATALHQKHYNLSDGLAIKGYDPVAYFTKGEAVKGKKELAVYVQGVTYYFSSAENKEAFKKNPAAYEPQFGGWCAYAMGNDGTKVSVDPETFKVLNGKLYLFYNKYFTNTLKSWNKDETNLKRNADANWAKNYH
jgi:YHS domain-containing protein